jgi:hypothetical protein
MTFKTDQEAFWAGDFGTEYIQRNQGRRPAGIQPRLLCQGAAPGAGLQLHRVRGQHRHEPARAQAAVSRARAHAIEINPEAAPSLAR